MKELGKNIQKFVNVKNVEIMTDIKSAKANCPITANVGVWYCESCTILPIVARFLMHPKNATVKITQVKTISKVVSLNHSYKINPSEVESFLNPVLLTLPMLSLAERVIFIILYFQLKNWSHLLTGFTHA